MRCIQLTLSVLLFGAGPAVAQDRSDFEDELFGAPEAVESSTAAATREDALFGGPADPTPPPDADGTPFSSAEDSPLLGRLSEALDDRADRLAIGGVAYLQLRYSALESGDWSQFRLSSPSTLDLYLDARPVDRVRGYVRARLAHDFTVSGDDAQEDLPTSSLAGFGQQPRTQVLLDQLWLKFDIDQRVFITAGKQRVRWGTGRLWNPTDALNAQRFNPLSLFDVRLGVGLVKVHVPFEDLGANIYAMALLDGADAPEEVGVAVRAEIAISPAEVALSAVYRRGEPWRFGFDVSGGFLDFDLRAEVAGLYDVRAPFFQGRWSADDPLELEQLSARYRQDEVIVQAVLGGDYTLDYGDGDQAIFGLEYFYNDAGYDGADLYPVLALAPALWQLEQTGLTSIGLRRDPGSLFQPFYLGRHYLSLLSLFPTPFGLEDHTFSLVGILNLSDESGVIRLDHTLRLFRFLSLRSYVNVYAGQRGEFKFGLDIAPVPGIVDSGVQVTAPLLDLGLALSATL